MKKQLILRALIGFLLGVCISDIILLILSLCFASGAYISCAPVCVERFGSELAGVTAQFFLSGLIGMVFAGATVIWEIETWSLLRSTVIHFLVTSVVFFPVSALLGWCALDIGGIIGYVGIYASIYVCVWISQYFSYKRKIQKINQTLEQ